MYQTKAKPVPGSWSPIEVPIQVCQTSPFDWEGDMNEISFSKPKHDEESFCHFID